LSENKKADILQAASELFVESGYDNASMQMIAKRAGVVPSHIYAFFEDKEALFEEVLYVVQDGYQSKMYETVQRCADLPPADFVMECLETMSAFRDEAGFVMASALTPKLRAKAEPVLKEYSQGMATMMEPLYPDLSDELRNLFGSLLLAISDSYIADGDFERASKAGVFAIDLFHHYLKDAQSGER